tara:strand:+ start:379 stop:1017 length:639 start_codon:yes stop_codon:yes gene_type:complete
MMAHKAFACLCLTVLSLSLVGCARQISPNVYSDKSVGETSRTYRGVVVSKRQVEVAGSDKLQENTTGALLGGAGGAVAGSAFGGGHGNTAATILGGIGGAVAGAYAQKALESQDGFEYVVELRGGELKTVVQGTEPSLEVGQNVLMMVSHKGRSRIVPDTTSYSAPPRARVSSRSVKKARYVRQQPRRRVQRMEPVYQEDVFDDENYDDYDY